MYFPLFSFALFGLLHWILSARMQRRGLKWILIASLAAFALAYLALPSPGFVYAAATHGLLLMLYLHFYVGVDRSVSVRVLHELYEAPGHERSPQALAETYPPREMFAHRVQLMVEHQWIRDENGRLYASEKSQILVLPTVWLRRLYDLRETW